MVSKVGIWIGYTVVAVAAFLTVFVIMDKMTDDTSFEQRFISKDLIILEDSALSAPYNLNVAYSFDDSYEVFFGEKCSLTINKRETPLYSGSINYCAADINFEVIYSDILDSGLVIFDKKENVFEVKVSE
jgi:hypothetical protein